MSFHVYFSFSTGLAKTQVVPQGTRARMKAHVEDVEGVLGLKTTQYRDNPKHWERADRAIRESPMEDKDLCRVVEDHNREVKRFYHNLSRWQKMRPDGKTERLTPKQAASFWHGLELLDVPVERWSEIYYEERMNELYEALRGRGGEISGGMTLDAAPLSSAQADSVIALLSEWLDPGDIRLRVPDGYDSLYRGEDAPWCGSCFKAIHESDIDEKCRSCQDGKNGACDIRDQYGKDEDECDDEDEPPETSDAAAAP